MHPLREALCLLCFFFLVAPLTARPQPNAETELNSYLQGSSHMSSIPFVADADPKCSTGMRSNKVCCSAACPSCTNANCKDNSLRPNCCKRAIWKLRRSCKVSGAPCIVNLPTPKPSPSTAPGGATSDPMCRTGLINGKFCCPASCGICGGEGCWPRGPGFGACCGGKISDVGKLCTEHLPPCLLHVAESPSPSPPAANGGKWKTLTVSGTPTARHEACFVWVDGKGYLIGGRRRNPVDVYDPATKTWTNKGTPPKQMHHMQCVGYKGKVFVASSWGGYFPREINNPAIYVYDTTTDTWTERPGLPEDRRRGGAAAVLHEDKIYVVAGNRGGHGDHATALGWMDYYDLKSEKWVTNLPTMPSPRDHTGGAMVNGRLCVAGGRDSGVANFFAASIASTWCYNFATRAWVNANASLPEPRAGAATATTCQGVMMVAGGEAATSPAKSRVDVFDGQKWRRVADLVRGRHGSGLGIAECGCGDVFIASGSGGKGGGPELESAEVYVVDGGEPSCGMGM